MAIEITNWGFSKRMSDDPWTPPEFAVLSLQGTVHEHPRYGRIEGGKEVITSEVIGGEGRLVRTASGSEYLLVGPPRHEYTDWLTEKGFDLDENNPLRSYAEQWFGPGKGGLEV